MKYDFTTMLDRTGMDAIALETIPMSDVTIRQGFTKIPMWVADMNFPTFPTIHETIIQRAKHPAYGYFSPSEEYYRSIINWQAKSNGVTNLDKEDIGYENSVLGGVVNALNVLCSKGDSVLLHSPAYIGFSKCLSDNGYDAVHSPLKPDEDGIWRMDFEDMDRKIKEKRIHAAIFCSPHNPCGRVWERWEIEKAMDIYRTNNVYVISDEIWSDLIMPGHKHIPTQSVSQDARSRTIALYAPSKTFNLAGLIGSYHIVYDSWLRDRIRKEAALSHYNQMNVLSMHALIGAYQEEGHQWVAELCETLKTNMDFACDFIEEKFPGISLMKPQGTYMLFLDCSAWCETHKTSLDELLRRGMEVGVIWQDGRDFYGKTHIRMNLALPLSVVREGFERLDTYVFHE